MATFVRFWGTRGSIPTPGNKTRKYGGNTSCIELRIDETLFVCDGGTGLRELGLSLAERGHDPIEAHMFFSHTHWDHIQGFPFFVPAYSPSTQLHVYDVSADDDRVHRLLLGQMQSDYFPVSFSDLGSRILSRNFEHQKTVIDGVTVSFFEQQHPGRSFAYAFEKGGTKVVYATDNELDLTLLNPAEVARDPECLRRAPEDFIRFVAGADLLIADGQYTDEEYAQKIGWGHARARTVVDLAITAGVKQCAIFHHDPMHSDDVVEDKIDDCRARARRFGSNLSVFGAREGLELKL
ncbi:MAG TPA: MBL fold metallo-hydrolase [Polyangiaceae bacterium]|nr:MBL fold metallo-hydrolase [Polyangiaceae bacterium]